MVNHHWDGVTPVATCDKKYSDPKDYWTPPDVVEWVSTTDWGVVSCPECLEHEPETVSQFRVGDWVRVVWPPVSGLIAKGDEYEVEHTMGGSVQLRTRPEVEWWDEDRFALVARAENFGRFETKDSGERVDFPSGMRRDTDKGKLRFDLIPLPMLKRLAGLYTRGAEKYGDNNYLLANSEEELARFKQSAWRHFIQWLDGERDEDHAMAVAFNIFAAELTREKLSDTPM